MAGYQQLASLSPASHTPAPSNPFSPQYIQGADYQSHQNAKVAIPRLHLVNASISSSPLATPPGKHRVSIACKPCRRQKTKCNGQKPACRHCIDFKIRCEYEEGRRDRNRRQSHHLAEEGCVANACSGTLKSSKAS